MLICQNLPLLLASSLYLPILLTQRFMLVATKREASTKRVTASVKNKTNRIIKTHGIALTIWLFLGSETQPPHKPSITSLNQKIMLHGDSIIITPFSNLMTDIQIKTQAATAKPIVGYYADSTNRKSVGTYNTSTHFIFGKHPTINLSETHLKTAVRDGLNKPRNQQIFSTAQAQATNFKLGPGPIKPENNYQSMYKVGTCRAPANSYYLRSN